VATVRPSAVAPSIIWIRLSESLLGLPVLSPRRDHHEEIAGQCIAKASVLLNDLPPKCAMNLPMPVDDDGGWVSLDGCARQLIEQWIESGADP